MRSYILADSAYAEESQSRYVCDVRFAALKDVYVANIHITVPTIRIANNAM